MVKSSKLGVIKVLSGTFKILTVSCFVGFGLTSCSHSSGDDSTEPVIAPTEEGAVDDAPVSPAVEANAEPASAEAAESADVTKTEPAEMPPALDDVPPAQPAEVAAIEVPVVAEEEVVADHPQEPTLPNDDVTTDTVQAELSDNAPVPPSAAPAVAVPELPAFEAPVVPAPSDSMADSFETKFPPPAAEVGKAIVEGNSISSPGAARFIKSNHESKRRGQKMATHKSKRPVKAMSQPVAGPTSGNYVVFPGDTLGTISRKIYGSNKEWKVLADLNGLVDPFVIRVGDVLKFDDSSAKAKAFASQYHATMKTVVVKSGDSLSKISAAVYGNSGKWKLLLGVNKDKITNPNQIAAGMSLRYVDISGAKATAVAPVKAKAQGKSTAKVQKEKSGSAAGAQQSE